MVSIVQFHPESKQPDQYIPVVQLNTVGAEPLHLYPQLVVACVFLFGPTLHPVGAIGCLLYTSRCV